MHITESQFRRGFPRFIRFHGLYPAARIAPAPVPGLRSRFDSTSPIPGVVVPAKRTYSRNHRNNYALVRASCPPPCGPALLFKFARLSLPRPGLLIRSTSYVPIVVRRSADCIPVVVPANSSVVSTYLPEPARREFVHGRSDVAETGVGTNIGRYSVENAGNTFSSDHRDPLVQYAG
jgi:hypothetical protein